MTHVLVILGHPERESFCGALAHAYAKEAQRTGHETTLIALSDLHFDPVLHHGYHEIQSLEPDLEQAQRLIAQADHLAIFFPLWWGSVPALCKGFIDRVFLPGFAFQFKDSSPIPEKLLRGRSADLVLTMGAPAWISRWFFGDPSVKMLKKGLLEFCGISPVDVYRFDRMEEKTEQERSECLEKVRQAARKIPKQKQRTKRTPFLEGHSDVLRKPA